ncbi:hypothetical protein E2C01_039206 [Portunus trituberculatus]|uniref:Uncharacterized protein n=1 Tax=Portunus trituberculatus TaxID=210409 RepID=A0A5B7FJ17_PORTR|nr:hypothetical protein [Portunus trituberculatus]
MDNEGESEENLSATLTRTLTTTTITTKAVLLHLLLHYHHHKSKPHLLNNKVPRLPSYKTVSGLTNIPPFLSVGT